MSKPYKTDNMGEIALYGMSVRKMVYKYLECRSKTCKKPINVIASEMLEAYIVDERSRERLKTNSVMEDADATEENDSEEAWDGQ